MVLYVYLEREDGSQVAMSSIADAAGFVNSHARGTSFLRFIDPYGRTVFNRKQCEALREEWRILESRTPRLQAWTKEVATLIERCANELHLYLRFEGD